MDVVIASVTMDNHGTLFVTMRSPGEAEEATATATAAKFLGERWRPLLTQWYERYRTPMPEALPVGVDGHRPPQA